MKGKFKLVTLVVASLVLGATAIARTEPNSFLNRPATSHSTLMGQVKTDRQVMDRFMRHFGLTRDQVIAKFSTLRLARLPQDGVYLVYNCSDNEEIRARVMFYRKGTMIWVDEMGTPILKMSCANPMVRGTDGMGGAELTATTPTAATTMRAMANPVGDTVVAMDMNPEAVIPGVPEASPLVFDSSAPVAPSLPSMNNTSGALALLPLVAGGLISRDRETPPVPEPTTMIALGAGVTMMIARRRSKKA